MSQQETDDALVGRCLEAKQSASSAFAELYARHAEAVLAFLYGMHRGDEHAARDALQETFVRFYTALPSFERGRPLRPWLTRIARNVTLDQWKHKARRPEVIAAPETLPGQAAEPGPAETAAGRELAGVMREAIYGLPSQELAVFLLRHDQGRTYAEVAEALSCSVRTAKYRMKAALERLGREAERLGVAQ